MVAALFTLTAGLDRARRQSLGAAKLALLQVVGDRPGVRPSEIAGVLQVSGSLITRQVQALEQAGLVTVDPDPADHRSCHVSLTAAGSDEQVRLQQMGLARFAAFVADWDAAEVVTLAALLRKLEASKRAVAARETRHAGRPRWARASASGVPEGVA